MIREKQDGEDRVLEVYNREYGGTILEADRVDGQTGKRSFAQGHASTSPQYEAWDKPAADGAAATATSEHSIFRAKQACKIQSVHYIPDAALTADANNNATITIKRRNADGTNAVTVAAATTSVAGTGNWSQWVAIALSLTVANLAMAAGQILTISISKAGTGVVVPAGQLVVAYQLT